MATHSSALKAHRQNLKRRTRNRELRGELRSALKQIRSALDAGNAATVDANLKRTLSTIDRMATKGVIHDNTAARYKSRLAKRLAARKTSPR